MAPYLEWESCSIFLPISVSRIPQILLDDFLPAWFRYFLQQCLIDRFAQRAFVGQRDRVILFFERRGYHIDFTGELICSDMWFPETTRTMASMGAEVILHPTLTSTIDREVELCIARATAATNQCFMVDINGSGDGGSGRSIICGPAGDVLHQFGASEELVPLEIDLERVRRYREVGLRGLGQPLKSFRDNKIVFPVYAPGGKETSYLGNLGPLIKQSRGSARWTG